MKTMVEKHKKIISHRGRIHGQAIVTRRIMGNYRTGFAQTATSPERRQAASKQSRSPDGDSFCTQDRHRLGISSIGDGMWFRNDMLASSSRLAEGRLMGQNTPYPAQQTSQSKPNRFFTSGSRFIFSSSCFWGAQTGPNPTDRRKMGSKHHIITDAEGVPLAVQLTGANRHDVTQLLPLVKAIPPIAGKVGRPRCKPDCVHGDRGYDSEPHRKEIRQKGIEPVLAKRRTENGSGLGVFRWVVERTLSWLHQFRRLRVRYERRADIHEALLKIGCIVICHNTLQNKFC
jgi:transposase